MVAVSLRIGMPVLASWRYVQGGMACGRGLDSLDTREMRGSISELIC